MQWYLILVFVVPTGSGTLTFETTLYGPIAHEECAQAIADVPHSKGMIRRCVSGQSDMSGALFEMVSESIKELKQ